MKRLSIILVAALSAFAIGIIAASVWFSQPPRTTARNTPIALNETLRAQETIQLAPRNTNARRNLAAIKVINHDSEYPITETEFENLTSVAIDHELDLGDSIENQIIVLKSQPNDSRDFKIEQRFETSMTVSDEGPHIDLTGWKHFTSEWREIKKLDSHRFLTSKTSDADRVRFPKVTKKQIYDAILKASDREWAEKARGCASPNSEPCGVGVSTVSLRISARENNAWSVIHQINFLIPMGC